MHVVDLIIRLSIIVIVRCLFGKKKIELQWCCPGAPKLELDRYIGQPIYIGRYQYQADISYWLSTTDKYRLTIACFIRVTVQSTNYF